MPRTIRDRMKGSLAIAHVDIERALDQLGEVYNVFSEQHPDMADGFALAAALLDKSRQIIDTLYQSAWGELPEDWEAIRERK